jgi:FERM/RhoGEF/pleckstrin domain protein 2
VVESVETFFLNAPQNAQPVMVESFTDTLKDDDDDEPDYAEVADIAPDPPKKDYEEFAVKSTVTVVLPYEQSYFMADPIKASDKEPKGCFESQLASASCIKSTLGICSANKNLPGLTQPKSPDKVIITQPQRSISALQSPLSEDEFMLTDEVFSPGTVKIEISPDCEGRPDFNFQQKFSRGSDTSIDDLLSASLSTLDDSQRRSSLEPRRLSSGSCKKCSGGSHSEEETSSFGTDLDGTVKMGVPARKCTHSSHSEDTSIGQLSLSEWSTGTNTVRQYANLSGSDSISNVSNQSAVKSEKSQNTKSSVSSINKSTESLNEKSMSLSGGKMLSFENNHSRDQNSDTDKITSSGTNDESTLTLTEMVQSMTSEWSTSTSQTLVEHDFNKQQQILDQKFIDKNKTSVEYMPLKPPKNIKRGNGNDRDTMPGIHQVKPKVEAPKPNTEKPTRLPPKIVDVIEKPNVFQKPKIPVLPPVDFDKNDSNGNGTKSNGKKPPLPPKNIQQPKSQEVSESESYSDKLYSQSDKLTERYQSQEFLPFNNGASTSTAPPTTATPPKSLTKHHSYDDKTLSKSQIREYKSSKVRQSQSFHEHLLSKDLNKIEEEKLSSSTTTHTSETTSESSPMFHRPDKLIKCSPYYSSSLSSDTPSIHQAISKPPRKVSIPKTLQTQSSNDTDSSLDFQAHAERNRGYRKKKQIPSTKRIKMDRATEYLESSECSDIPEIHSSSSDNAKRYPDFEEEPENLPDDCDDYFASSSKFETLDMSENVDEMGFPRYDRLRHMATNLPPQKPARQKKKTTSKVSYPNVHYGQDSGSNSETKAGLSDDFNYSSEDSFAAGFQKPSTSNSYRNIELPYPDFLSDNDEINEATMAAAAAAAYRRQNESFDSEEDEASENRKF